MDKHPKYYPIMADVTDATCVVVGGGPIGWRKIAGLLDCGARVVVVSPDGVPALEAAERDGKLVWHRRRFRPGDLAGAALAFAATNDEGANAAVREEARREGVLLNAAYGADQGDFLVPSVVRRGRLVLAVATGGASPKLARRIAREWERTYGPEYEAYTEMLDRLRSRALSSEADAERKLLALGELLETDALERLRAGASPAEVEADCMKLLQSKLQNT
ncbi:NAD(P)-dependent oxidoreductase [Paenibacillus sp.]|uniref:precorrin-2 dehydrogenase/sirohydrochlorin ferrochelatase family protein n=1 Tax=Paenibacillus sp. TaxID=58172 RepID=UPI002810BD19|nr:NAD(P)-dependent oxidoreductase [Paenibacillus sp.]